MTEKLEQLFAQSIHSRNELCQHKPIGKRISAIIRATASFLILAPLLLACTGCGTILARNALTAYDFEDPTKRIVAPVYPATVIDAGYISASVSGHYGDKKISAGDRVVVCFGVILDIPISLTTDTLCLPYDIYQASSK